jgi:vacuolar-type H+-ATPase subunit H
MTANLENLGYAQAQSSDSLEDRANEAMASITGFPEDISPEAKAALYRGYIRRWSERNPAKVYAIIGGNYTLATPEILSNKKVEKIEVGAEYAFSFSTHEYGKLGQENPQLRKIVQEVRQSAQDYCSNRLGDLKRAAKKILSKAQGGQTRETKSFEESAKKVFNDWEKSVKTKSSRGDASAKPDKFKAAVAAFWKAYNA